MKTINYFLVVLLSFAAIASYAQSSDSLKLSPPKTEKISLEEKVDYKFFDRSFDLENIKLNKANDTLNIFIDKQKKISLLALDITNLKDFNGFEKDIEGFLTAINQVGLDFSQGNYSMRYMPESKELRIEERMKSSYKFFEEGLIPLFRQEIVFAYPGDLIEVVLFLGDLDELEVLKEANFSVLIKDLAEENDWYQKYRRSTFNKDVLVNDQGDLEVITYANLEKDADFSLSFGLDVGVSYIAKELPFRQEVSVFLDSEKYNKARLSDDWKSGIFLSLDLYQFYSRDDENRVVVDAPSFANIGLITGPKSTPIGIYYGRLVFGDSNDRFRFNKNKIGLDILVESRFRVRYEIFIGINDSDWINSLGITIPIINNR